MKKEQIEAIVPNLFKLIAGSGGSFLRCGRHGKSALFVLADEPVSFLSHPAAAFFALYLARL